MRFTIDALSYVLKPPPWTTDVSMTDQEISDALATVLAAIPDPHGTAEQNIINAVAGNAFHRTAAPRPNDRLGTDLAEIILSHVQMPGGALASTWLANSTLVGNWKRTAAIRFYDKVASIVRCLKCQNSRAPVAFR